jgi:methyltransferase (TIGR00027 family)
MPSTGPISHVSDTARWVALYRAMESERPDALFHDPYARRLAGERGEQILRSLRGGRAGAWSMIVRTTVLDEMILRAVMENHVDAVLNLASGLDTRAYRLPLPRGLRWIDVDFPDVVAYKQTQLANEHPACDLEYAAVDLTDAVQRDVLFARVGSAGRRVLVITEGLLIYLLPEQVAELARALHAQPSFYWWLMDLGSPRVLQYVERRWGKTLAQGNAPFRFAPAEGTAFFAPYGWRESQYRSMWDESIRLKRTMRWAWFWNIVGRFAPKARREELRRMSGVVLFERR